MTYTPTYSRRKPDWLTYMDSLPGGVKRRWYSEDVRPRFTGPSNHRVSSNILIGVEEAYGMDMPSVVATYTRGNNYGWYIFYQNGNPLSNSILTPGYNRLYGRFVEKLRGGDSAELGETLATYKENARFAADRLEAVSDFTEKLRWSAPAHVLRAERERLIKLRSKRWRGFSSLPTQTKRRLIREKWRVPRWLGSRWLDYWFVIAPLVSDIDTSLKVLSRDIPFGSVRATYRSRIAQAGGTKPPAIGANAARYWHSSELQYWMSLNAQVRLKNPNWALANSLGLGNPVTVMGQLLPWSWLVGWFVNWEQVLNSWTDLAPYELRGIYTTIKTQSVESQFYQRSYFANFVHTKWQHNGFARTRDYSVPMPKLTFQLPERLSVSRAATSMSLVVNIFTQ